MATTISISNTNKERLRNLGRTGESYDDVITKILNVTRKHLLETYLHDMTDAMTIDEALTKTRKKWSK